MPSTANSHRATPPRHAGWRSSRRSRSRAGRARSSSRVRKSTQEAKLLTILVEFDEDANDDFSGSYVPTEFGSTECKPGEVQNGPLHNNIPNPADYELEDNNSMWVPDFSSEHFNKMLFTDSGITERVRTDLTGPDGQPGFDISGYTMKTMYEEMSRGAYTVTGEATPWITVPHSEAYYGASLCFQNEAGEYEAGAIQDMQGHPDNPLGPGQLPIDAVAALADAQPDFPWADYDIEDQGDRDGDDDFLEPDGVIDHVVLVHAGEDKSGGGGAEGTYALWAHSSAVAGGADIPGTDLKLSNYIVQPEDSGVGVFAHEYGHDLGLPDLYDTSGVGNSDVDFWDLMSSGSHSGPIFQSMPTHMGLWDKWVLGWADPVVVNPGDDIQSVKVGQTSKPAKGTAGRCQDQPARQGDHTRRASQRREHVVHRRGPGLGRPPTRPHRRERPGGCQVLDVERLRHRGGLGLRLRRGLGRRRLHVDRAQGLRRGRHGGLHARRLRRPERTHGGLRRQEVRPDRRLARLGAPLRRPLVVRRPDGGRATPPARRMPHTRTAVGSPTTSRSRAQEPKCGPTTSRAVTTAGPPRSASFTTTTGPGWRIDTGTSVKAQYYLVEWRNFNGFDEGLKYAYNTVYSAGAWKVEKLQYNAPGALVWYRDTTYGSSNQIRTNETALPSFGAKGGLLLVDSHFDPLRRTGTAADVDPTTLNNMPSRAQSSNVAFGLTPTYPFTECITRCIADRRALHRHPGQRPGEQLHR